MSSDASANPTEQIFICGAPRTGTSVMAAAIHAAFPHYQAFKEGHLLDGIPGLVHWVEKFLNVNKKLARQRSSFMVAGADEVVLKSVLVKAVCDYALTLTGTGNFIEKTPGASAIRALPYLSEVFPNGKAIVLRRRAIEYLRSARVKFGDHDNLQQQWVSCMGAIADMEAALPGFVLVIEHRDIVTNPSGTAEVIANHLGIREDGRRLIERTFADSSIQKTPGTTYDPLDLRELCEDDDAAASFIEETKDIFERFGYSYDKHYYRNV